MRMIKSNSAQMLRKSASRLNLLKHYVLRLKKQRKLLLKLQLQLKRKDLKLRKLKDSLRKNLLRRNVQRLRKHKRLQMNL